MGTEKLTTSQKEIIGRRKYEALKAFDLENLTEENLNEFSLHFPNITVAEALKSIEKYENATNLVPNLESVKEYSKKIFAKDQVKEPILMTKKWLWNEFVKNFYQNEGVQFSQNFDSLENIKPLIYYFIGDEENFIKCQNVSLVSKPSLEKGLLIMGGYGNGKTSIMRALEKSLEKSNVRFKGYTANDIVMMYEACETPTDKQMFNNKVRTGTLYFDDVLTEEEANNYGKTNLFKIILEERYHQKKRTYLTCNYREGNSENIDDGLLQFGEKYGSRVYDRLFKMFNIIQFKGKSLRL